MSEIKLRDYQQEAVNKIMWAIKLEGNDLVVLPTGAGKSIVIAETARQLNQPVLILQPSKEILTQNRAKLALYVPEDEIGVYSASLGQRDIRRYTFATIQSIYKKPEDFSHFKLVIIDECHLVNVKALGSMFSSFLKAIGNPKVIGFTATPYRNFTGYHPIGGGSFEAAITLKLINRVLPKFWARIIFNINNKELVDAGYLTRLTYIDSALLTHEEIPLNKSRSDFDLDAFEARLTSKQSRLLDGISWAQKEHHSVLVFCSSVSQAETLSALVPNSAVVSAKTKPEARDQIISDFKNLFTRVVFNVGVLTTGFDHPQLDCIILARPTRSLALYYQMLGRGVRIAEGKTTCTVVDFTSTVKNLGEIESIRLEKENMWELKTSTGNWHNRQLYSFTVSKN